MAESSTFNERWIDPAKQPSDAIGRIIDLYQREQAQLKALPVTRPPALAEPITRGQGNPDSPTVVIVDKKDHVTHPFQKNSATGTIEEVFNTRDATGIGKNWTLE